MFRQGFGAVVVHDLEQPLDADHASGAARLDLVSEELDEGVGADDARLPRTSTLNCSLLLPVLAHSLCWSLLLGATLPALEDLRKLLIINTAIAAPVIVLEDHFQVLYKTRSVSTMEIGMTYHAFGEDDADFLYGPAKLIFGHAPLVLNVKEFKSLRKEGSLFLCGWTLLLKLCLQVSLKPIFDKQ